MRLISSMLILLACLSVLSACSNDDDRVTVWFVDGRGAMVSEERTVVNDGEATQLELALAELVFGPDNTDLVSGLPSDTRFDAEVADGIATLDLGAGFSSGLSVAGSAATIQAIAPVIWTATEIDGVTSVLLREGGEILELKGSGIVFDDPLTRDDFPGTP